MKTKQFIAVLGYPYPNEFVIRVIRWVKGSKPRTEESRYYKYSYSSDHIYTVMKRFSEMVRIHHINVVKYFKEQNETSSSGQ